MPLIERKVQNKSSWRDHFTINKKLLPLKFTLFFFSASAFSILPYLTIHMKDIGIKVEHIALMYAILPFTIFFGKNNSVINSKLSSWKKISNYLFFCFSPTICWIHGRQIRILHQSSSFDFVGFRSIPHCFTILAKCV